MSLDPKSLRQAAFTCAIEGDSLRCWGRGKLRDFSVFIDRFS
jgi:hypothetical protein